MSNEAKTATKTRALCFFLLLAGCAHASTAETQFTSCSANPALHTQASAELKHLADEDQSDRQGSVNAIDWPKVTPRDLARRVRVAEIFAEGCFRDAQDYAAAAIIYQHGDTADHVFQAFVWAKKAFELGDITQKWLIAAGLDRFLVRTGQKQLFATQYSKDVDHPCWCLEPVEDSFPENKRVDYAKKNLQQALEQTKAFNTNLKGCSDSQYCRHPLKATPAGTVPGFW